MKYFRLLHIFICYCCLPLNAQTNEEIPSNGPSRFYYENGAISSEGIMRDGKPDGYWKTYYLNGKLKSEGNRKNFLLDSIWKFYNEQGYLTLTIAYVENHKTGFRRTYKKDTLLMEEYYVNDIKQGPTNYFYKNGKLKLTVPFDKGREEGRGYELDMDSTIITIIDYKMGFEKGREKINRRDENNQKYGVWKEFYKSMVVKSDGYYIDGKKNGYFKYYSEKGLLLKTEKYVNDRLIKNAPELAKLDMQREYYPDGKVRTLGGYKDGVPEGVHREFSETGEIVSAKIYADGILIGEGIVDSEGRKQGPWKEFYPSGQLQATGKYLNGKRIDDWVFYHPNGKIEQKGMYDKKGRAQGLWQWFYENGNMLREENYTDDLRNGPMVEYNDSGKTVTKGEYVDGLQEGVWFYELGDYREEGTYKSDKRDGEWKHFYLENGKLRFEGKFFDGDPIDEQRYFYPNGKLKEVGSYSAGKQEGDWRYFNDAGEHILTITFKDGEEVKIDGIKLIK